MPIYIGASGPAATRLAGRIADGFITTSGKGHELYTDTLLPAVREGAEKAGRTLDDLDLMIEVKVSFDPDLERARTTPSYWGALALSPGREDRRRGPDRDAAARRRAAGRAHGDPLDRLRPTRTSTSAKVAEYLDMGFQHLVFHAPGPDQERFLRALRRGDPAQLPRAGLSGRSGQTHTPAHQRTTTEASNDRRTERERWLTAGDRQTARWFPSRLSGRRVPGPVMPWRRRPECETPSTEYVHSSCPTHPQAKGCALWPSRLVSAPSPRFPR